MIRDISWVSGNSNPYRSRSLSACSTRAASQYQCALSGYCSGSLLPALDHSEIQSDSFGSTSLLTLTKGDMVLVLEQQEDWCKVRYQTTTGYMQTKYLQETLEEDTQNGALQEEMQDIEEFHQEVAVEAEKVSRDKKTSLYWGIVIGGLIIAMFAAGIYRGIKGDKKE